MPLLVVPTGVTEIINKVQFFRLPTIVRDKGDQMLSIMTERRCVWLKAISRQDLVGEKLKNTFVCEKHFEKSMLDQHDCLCLKLCVTTVHLCIISVCDTEALHMFA